MDWQRLWPQYWMQNSPTNYEWDAILNDLLDRYSPKEGHLTVFLGEVEVWVSNWPYAYGSPYLRGRVEVLPTVATRKRLRSSLKAASVPPDPLGRIRKLIK